MSFMRRVPYSIALMATALGLLMVCPLLTEAGPRDDLAPVNDPLNFTQVVNHFDSLDGRTFHQRYWVNPRWWKVPEQVEAQPMALLRINSFHWDGDWNTSTVAAWAQELGAIVYDLEPRYAGKSYPVPDVATSDLRYYSIEQNVADVVNFIREQSASLPNNTRWVVMGSLFDGAFATWVSARPRVAFGVVAVSPYLLAVESYTGYDLAYQAAIGRTCARVLHNLLETASFALNVSAESRAQFQTQCGVAADDLLPNAEFMYVLSTILLGSLDADSISVCKTFADVQSRDNATRLTTLANFVVQYNEENWMTFVGWDFARDTGGNRTDPGAGFRPSYYLQCTQLGQFQVSSGTEYSLLAAEVNLDWYLSVCQKLFSNLVAARPNVKAVNANFGGAAPEGCNMAFVLSPNDPYSGLGPDAAVLAADQATTGNKVVQINCPEAQVGLSLFAPASSGDPACLGQARNDVLQTLKLWQTQEDTCPTATSTGDGGGGGGGGHDDGDMALVGVFSAVGGALLALVIAVVLFAFFGRRLIQKWKASFFSKIN